MPQITPQIIKNIFLFFRILIVKYYAASAKENYLKNRSIFWLNFLSIAINFIVWIFIIRRLLSQEELIPLHYNVYFGVDFIGQKKWLLNLPLIGLFILLVNFFLSWLIYKREKLVSYILAASGLVTQLILAAAAVLIVNI